MNHPIRMWKTNSVWWAETLVNVPEIGHDCVMLIRTFGNLGLHQKTSVNVARRTAGDGLVWYPGQDWGTVACEFRGCGGSEEGVRQQHKTVVENLSRHIEDALAYYKGKAS